MRRYGIRIQWLFGYVADFVFVFPVNLLLKEATPFCVGLGPPGNRGAARQRARTGRPGPATQI